MSFAIKHYIVILCVHLSVVLLYCNLVRAQERDNYANWPEPVFEHLTIADGLPENSVRCILQDHLGYMWFGTQNGLVRYDGYNMKVYQPDPDDSLSISHRQIQTIFEDGSGTLWVGTGLREAGGLNKFDRAKETFTSYLHNSDDSTTINSNDVRSIYEDNNGNLLVGTSEGLNLLDKKTDKFKHIYYQVSVYSPAVYKYISSLIANGKRISSILQVGDNANHTKTFTINKKTVVLSVSMNETSCDYGWLENSDGDIIMGQNNKNLICAGGHAVNEIQIEVDTLNRGNYKLRYVSDNGYSYNSWEGIPPDRPEFWGIQVIEITEDPGIILKILDKKETIRLKAHPQAVIEDQLTGNIIAGGLHKLFIYDTERMVLIDYPASIRIEGFIRSLQQSRDRTIWIGHSRGLSKFDLVQNSIKLYQPVPSDSYSPENNFSQLIEDSNGLIWSGSGNSSLLGFDPINEHFKKFKLNPNEKATVIGVLSVYQDYSGIIWAGTSWRGLNKLDRKKHKFNRFSFDPNNPADGKFNRINSIIEDSEGVIWFGTGNGLNSYDRNSGNFRNYKYDKTGKDNTVTHIYKDELGIIWLGTLTRGLVKFDPASNTFSFYLKDPNDSTSISDNYVRFILPDENEVLWIGTWAGGLNKFDKKTGIFTRYLPDVNNPRSLSHQKVSSIFRDRNGTLWVGTDGPNGLNRYDKAKDSFTAFGYLDRINSVNVNTIYEDHNGNFWVGSYANGIYLFDRNSEEFVYSINQRDGLAHNTVRSIIEDDSGNLWISTNNGLSRFNSQTRTIKNYFISEIFEENYYLKNSVCKTSTGEMLFGTYDGFIMFHPDSIKDDPVPPRVVISNVSLFNEPDKELKFDGFISELKELNLSYNENDLRFDYVGLHYGDPSRNQYKYKLEGFDKDWIDAGTQRNATYTNLDAGEYVFRVIACNADGVWNEEGASLKIIIPPPFWATWWAYSLYVLFILGVLYSIRRYEMNRTQLKNQVKLDEVKLKEREETDRMKSRFFANISHEFRTPLTLISGPIERILSRHSDEETIKEAGIVKRNASRLLGLINQLLDLSKLEAGKLELKASKSNIVPFIKGITMSFESVAEGTDITLKVKSSNDEIDLYFDKEKMTKIMTNLLSNAFKFTDNGGHITVSINENDENLICVKVRDTGVGISQEELPKLFDRFYQVDSSQTREHEGTGIGLALTKELVELHHGTISADSKFGEWTELTIELPVGRSHLKDEEIVEDEVTSDEVIMDPADSRMNSAKNLSDIETVNSSSFFDRPRTPQNDSEVDEDKYIVLVVEDNADVREFIKDSLGNEFQIEEASNGEQGARKAEQIIPDLIISDIMMPKMDGNELTKKLKSDAKTSHIPIILLTAKSEQQSKIEGLEIGADDYLTKPFDTKELQIRINNLINIRRKLQQKFSKVEFVPEKKTEEKKLNNLEEKFICKVMEVIEKHLSEEEFSIKQFGKEVGMSRVQLHRKLKALSGKSASNYLRSVRLNKAKQMIEEERGNISEIAYSVGFSSPQYFTRCFKEEFGIPPSELSS